MKPILLIGCVLLGAVLWLAGCASDDEPFPVHSEANADVPVAGAATPARGDSSAGWKW